MKSAPEAQAVLAPLMEGGRLSPLQFSELEKLLQASMASQEARHAILMPVLDGKMLTPMQFRQLEAMLALPVADKTEVLGLLMEGKRLSPSHVAGLERKRPIIMRTVIYIVGSRDHRMSI